MWKLLLFLCVVSVTTDYPGYKVLEVRPGNEKHARLLVKLADEGKIDVLGAEGDHYNVLMSPKYERQIISILRAADFLFSESPIDIAKDIQVEAERLEKRSSEFNYDDFNDLETINEEISRIASKCLAGFDCEVDSIGMSLENREIKRLIIRKAGSERKVVWLDATTHAREWLTTATLFKIIKHLMENQDTDQEAKRLLSTYDWHFLPVLNPDGYIHTWKKEGRGWRKNRRVNANSTCKGVDLNRNANHSWATIGSSNEPCSEIYHGSKAASEVETVVVQKALTTLSSTIIQYISLHSFGNYWLIPFGNKDMKTKECQKHSDDEETMRVANAAADAIEKVHNTTWKRGHTCLTIYPTAGGMMDFVKGVAGIKYAAVPAVRGPGFVVPPSAIQPSFEEIWAGIVASMGAIEKEKSDKSEKSHASVVACWSLWLLLSGFYGVLSYF